nr:hypothetical protein [Agromyces badenianii]
MPGDACDDRHRDPLLQEEGECSVPQIMEANLGESCILRVGLEQVAVSIRAQGFTCLVGYHDAIGLTLLPERDDR